METETVENNVLIQVVKESGLEPTKSQYILEKFQGYFKDAAIWEKKANELVITDISQKREMLMARQARLALKDIRVNADKTRRELKEQSLREGKAIQGVYNVIEHLIIPIEEDLERKEKFAEMQEAKRKELLKAQRAELLAPYTTETQFYDLANMSQESFDDMLSGLKLAKEARIEAERKAEEDRLAKIKAEAEERERVRLENERLKAEAEQREKEMKAERERLEAERKLQAEKERKEREAIEAKAKAEREEAEKKMAAERKEMEEQANKLLEEKRVAREAQEKAEAELKAKQEAEAKAEKERIAAEKKAARAPDKKKLIVLADQLEAFVMPEVKSPEAQAVLDNTLTLVLKVCKYLRDESGKL